MKNLLKLFFITVVFSVVLIPSQTFSVSAPTGVNLQVTGVAICNNNGICESGAGENTANCPADCPAAQGGGALFIPDSVPPSIYNLSISEITINSAIIYWETNEFSLCQISLGKTEEYESEIMVETALYKLHSKSLTNLSFAQDYHFKIYCKDASNNGSETTNQKFTTLTPPDTVPPANVMGLEALSKDSEIDLYWNNPKDSDFKEIKIFRSETFYPKDQESGILVYGGAGESFFDTGLTNGTRYYYTAFSYDKAGNYSSGAVVSAIPQKPGEKPPIIVPPIEPPATTAPPEIEKITLNDFDFLQQGEKITISEEKGIEMKAEFPLTVKIDYEKVPEVLKTIMITLKKSAVKEGEQDKFFSFLLRIDKEKTAYLATLVPPESGIYPLTISVMDYNNQALKQIEEQLTVLGEETAPARITFYQKWSRYLYLFLGLIILAIAVYFYKNLKQRKSVFI